MSLQLILGSSGSGKSHYIYEKTIQKELSNPNQSYYIIVPDQYSVETQNNVIQMHPNRGLFHIDILGFTRFAYRIFDELGDYTYLVLDDIGKNLILQKVMEGHKKELKVFENKASMKGFTSQMNSVLSELYQYGIDEKKFADMLTDTRKKPLLNQKLQDIELIYRAFKEYIDRDYIISEELLQILCEVIDQSEIVRNSEFILDGFNGFTPLQYRLIRLLMRYAKKVTIAITVPKDESSYQVIYEHELFKSSKETMRTLIQLALEEGIDVLDTIYMEDYQDGENFYRFKNFHAMQHLEKNLFRYKKEIREENHEGLRIIRAKNPYEESAFVVNEINRLIREEGYRYREIAIITGDIEGYRRDLSELLEQNEIPYFLDYKRNILKNPMVELIRSFIEMAIYDMSYESVFRYLRSQMVDFTLEEIDLLENYVLAFGIRGMKAWEKEWTLFYGVIEEEELEEMNSLREKFYCSVEKNLKILKRKATVGDYTKAIYNQVESLHVQEKLEQYQLQFKRDKKLSLAKEYDQTYGLCIKLMEQIFALLGEEEITILEYARIFDAGFEELEVGVIPIGNDQIIVGDIERTRLNHIKALFVVGVNDGIIPNTNVQHGVLTEGERSFLLEQKYEIAPTNKENAFMQKFYLYQNLTKPENKLYLTYAASKNDGKSIRPSYLISSIKSLYENLQEEDFENELHPSNVNNEFQALRYAADGIREYVLQENNPIWKELYRILWENENTKLDLYKLIEAAIYKNDSSPIGREIAQKIYGDNKKSITRLEQFAACEYSQFLIYGLKLEDRLEYQTRAADYGTIYHNALEVILKRIEKEKISWENISQDVLEELVKNGLENAVSKCNNTAIFGTARNAYMITRVKRTLERTLWVLVKHITKGKFQPKKSEMRVPHGRIDRLDMYEDESNVFVKIIDYKSGEKKFDIVDTYFGLQLQLVLYMGEALEQMKKEPEFEQKRVVAGGMFYYTIKDPFDVKETVDDVEGKYLSIFSPSGLINSRLDVLQAFDTKICDEKENNAKYSSNVVKLNFNAKGELKKDQNIADENQFQQIIAYAKKKAAAMSKEIDEGMISLNPYQKSTRTPCDYCDYRSVCEFDVKLPGNKYRQLPKLDRTEVWKIMEEDFRQLNGQEEVPSDEKKKQETEDETCQ